jgi:hypothetical protein
MGRIKVGDQVVATDAVTAVTTSAIVTATWVHDDVLLNLDVAEQALTTTEDHPFWNATDQQWQEAQALTPGDQLLTPDGTTTRVGLGLDWSTARLDKAYNLTVADVHTYYVLAGDTPVLVHNTGPVPGCGGPSYTSQSATHSYTHGHAANSPRIPGKSRFRVTEGGQKFTDEVVNFPGITPVTQANGRIVYDVPNLGRGPVGWDRYGNPAYGGRVVIEGPNPGSWSTFAPGEVVTQFPI